MTEKLIGFIGLGTMGMPMAANIMKNGYPLMVCDVRPEAVDVLAGKGARAASVAGIAAEADIVITILPRDAQILQVYTGEGGLFATAREGLVCIEMTSARGETVKRLEEEAKRLGKRVRFLDAPVSGGVAGAENGALTAMVGGDKALLEECRPLLETMCKKIFYTGGLGSGKSVKMINQLLNAGNTCVAAEALFLARRLGINMDTLCEAVKGASGNSWVFENNIQRFMLPGKFDAGFRLDLLTKDIGPAMELAVKDGLALPVLSLVCQVYQAMENQGNGALNYNVVKKWVEQQNPGEEL